MTPTNSEKRAVGVQTRVRVDCVSRPDEEEDTLYAHRTRHAAAAWFFELAIAWVSISILFNF